MLGSEELMGQPLVNFTLCDLIFALTAIGCILNFIGTLYTAVMKTQVKPALCCIFGLAPIFVFGSAILLLFT